MNRNPIKKITCSEEGVAIDRRVSHHFYQPRGKLMEMLAVTVYRQNIPVRPLLAPGVGWIAEIDPLRTIPLSDALEEMGGNV